MKNRKWSDAIVYNLEEIPVNKKPHAWYHLLSSEESFKIVLLQTLFAQSDFHFHPVPEIFFVFSGKLSVETDSSKKEVLPESLVFIPANVIHRVKNGGPQSKTRSILLIGEDWREEDVVHVEKRGSKWVEK